MTNDKDSAVLLRCPVPWCNSVNVSPKVFEAKRKKHWLQCNDCGFSTPQMTSRAKAENIWNTRQPTQSDTLAQPKKLTVSVVSAADGKTMNTFKIDPTEKTYVRPEHSLFGYVFEPEEEQSK